jgi:Rieske Fe-S protein
VAAQASCPHAGCPLGYAPGDQLIECPCHGSEFRIVADPANPKSCVGDVVRPPAAQGLLPFPIVWEPQTNLVVVDLLGRTAVCGPVLPPAVAGKVSFAVSDYPDLAAVGGALVAQAGGVPDKFLVMRIDASTVDTVSAICRHLGCVVGYTAASRTIDCPCHGSQYALDGSVIHGPTTVSGTTSALRSYPTTFDGTNVTITVS